VANLSYDTRKSQLKKEFERYGTVKTVVLVKDRKHKPRGYAFVEFKHGQDMKGERELANHLA